MAMFTLWLPALKQAIDQQAEKRYVKTIGACTEAGYRPADRQMARLKRLAPALKQAIDQQADKWQWKNYRRLH